MKLLVTGAAGFIGFHLTKRLLDDGHSVCAIDNLNDYYDPQLKRDRLSELGLQIVTDDVETERLSFTRGDITVADNLSACFTRWEPEIVVHLAAQAGVRYSIEHPEAYIQSNLVGFANILEQCRRNSVRHLIYASSSSVYGLNSRMPFSVTDRVDHPVSLYAATKKSNELMAHVYSHLYRLPTTGLRFFTVYGPWGRPDMAPIKFAKSIFAKEPIDVYNHGDMKRDFTYIDDIVEGVVRVISASSPRDLDWDSADSDRSTSSVPYRIHNIGRGEPIALLDFITAIEKAAGYEAKLNMLPMQPGDVKETYADTTSLVEAVDYRPRVDVIEGVRRFVEWFRTYYKV